MFGREKKDILHHVKVNIPHAFLGGISLPEVVSLSPSDTFGQYNSAQELWKQLERIEKENKEDRLLMLMD